MIKDTNFKCKVCGKDFEEHQAKTFNCPLTGSGKKVPFNHLKTYVPNYDKPTKRGEE